MHVTTRRQFTATLGLSLAATALDAQTPQRKLKFGHTGITWGFRPDDAEQAIKDVGSLGFYGYESFGNVLEAWESKGGLSRILDSANLPLISAYCPINLTEPAKRKDETDKIVRWAKLIKKCGGSVAVIGPNNVTRPGYDFAATKPAIVAALNDYARAVADVGVTGVLHQHTGTCVEMRDEVYAVMESVDHKYVKLGPDIGQLAKGGSDPVQIIKDFLPQIHHVHFKDYLGGPHWVGYCPLGQGKIDLPAVLALLEKAPDLRIAMVELDPSPNPPTPPLESARIAREYLMKLGYTFRTSPRQA